MAGRREEVLDAAISVLGTEGARGLTYQAVDSAAGAPAGTTSNHFRNRAALLEGVAAHLEELDRRSVYAATGRSRPTDVDGTTAAIARFVRNAVGPERHRNAARYGLFLEAISRPELTEPLARSRAALLELGIDWLASLGSAAPEAHCDLLLEYLDGMILRQVTFPVADFDPEPKIRTLLEALLSRERSASF